MKPGDIVSLRWREWAPAALVSALVLVGGARLIALSTQQRIAENREVTAGAAERTASRIEAELEALAERANREAVRAVDVLGRSRLPDDSESVASDEDGFWTASDGSIIPAAYPTDAAAARDALAREWRAGDSDSAGAGTQWLAPVRHGSQWLVTARAPILLSTGSDVEHAGWAIVYRALEEMLLRAGVDELPGEGYELALGQRAPGSDAPRLLLGSWFVASPDDLTHPIRLPNPSSATVSSEPYMVLALRPSAGWYSRAGLTANIGLLLVLTWLLGLAAYDLVNGQSRWRAAFALARQRLATTNRRLTEEVAEHRELQLSFEHARLHDAFTGLPNRRYFMNRLDQALREMRGGRRQQIAVVLVDIDRFKLVNDTLGQTAGDELMVQTAQRFEAKIGGDQGYVLARWSGDQFALLLFDVHSSDTARGFAKLLGDALARPFILRRNTLSVAAHMGITCVDTEPQRTEDVVRAADIALSVAKKRGATDPVFYEAALGEDVVSTVSLEADLHVALEREQFRLLFQPIVDLEAGRVVGAEALLRWHHPVEGLLAPDRFLSIAEDARLIVPISRWVIGRACKLGGEWRRHVQPDTGFYVSVNLAATALDDPHLVPYVAAVLKETGLPAKSLRFELTEAELTPRLGAARAVLDALHDMGVGLVLDDFGTGYSSLCYLELFPIGCVKIDRPFVNASDGRDSDVMRSVVHMASSLGLEAVAEKVETESAVEALKRMGCKYGQGYFLGEPLEPEHLLARVGARASMTAPQDTPTLVLPVGRITPDTPTLVLPMQPMTPDTPTLALPTSSAPVAPDAPTLVLPDGPGTAHAPDELEVEHAGVSNPATHDSPTLNQVGPAAAAEAPADVPTRVAPSPPENVQRDAATLALPTSPELLAPPPDEPTVVLREGPTEAPVPEERTIEHLGISDPAARDDAPTLKQPATAADVAQPSPPESAAREPPTVELLVAARGGDATSDGDELTTPLEAPSAWDDDSATQRFARRRLARGTMSRQRKTN